MINCAKECITIFGLLLVFVIGSVLLMPIAVLGVIYFVILAIVKWDIKYIDEEF